MRQSLFYYPHITPIFTGDRPHMRILMTLFCLAVSLGVTRGGNNTQIDPGIDQIYNTSGFDKPHIVLMKLCRITSIYPNSNKMCRQNQCF